MTGSSLWIRFQRLLGIPRGSVFSGIEHVGLYPSDQADSHAIAKWYEDKFGFKIDEGNSSILLHTDSFGFLEIMKGEPQHYSHIAVFTPDFEDALRSLDERGIAYMQPVIKPDVKIAYLKELDPSGNRVHLVWRKR